jgi:hypothetical protein
MVKVTPVTDIDADEINNIRAAVLIASLNSDGDENHKLALAELKRRADSYDTADIMFHGMAVALKVQDLIKG